MLKTPLVSFIVTSYNYSKFIEKTLDSIKNQDYENFEIIVVDDFSEDNSVEIIERYIQFNQDIRITFIKHTSNLGQMASMMDGLKVANGVFISFVDSDDMLLPDYTKINIKTHLSSSVAFTSSKIVEIDENDEVHTLNSISSANNQDLKIKKLEDLLNVDTENIKFEYVKEKRFGSWYWSPNSSAMYRKSVLEIMLLYDGYDKWHVCPDKFIFNILHLIGGSIVIDANLTARRLHKNNAGQADYVIGDTKYNNNKTTLINIDNNIKIKPEALNFILKNKNKFVKKFGTRGFYRIVFKIILPF